MLKLGIVVFLMLILCKIWDEKNIIHYTVVSFCPIG